MTHQVLTINHRRCHFLCAEQPPQCVVVKPLCAFERLRLEDEFALSVRLAPKAFAMVAFEVERAEFSHAGFPILLQYIDNALLAAIHAHYGDLPIIVGGYSLGGLFALWCATQRPYFKAVAACSPSLWAEGWQTYYEQHPTKAEFVYMSMGKDEERTQKNALQNRGRQMSMAAQQTYRASGGEPLRTALARWRPFHPKRTPQSPSLRPLHSGPLINHRPPIL